MTIAFTNRSKYIKQFNAEAVQLVIDADHPNTEVARELGINEGTLGNWITKYRTENPEPPDALPPS